MFGWLRRIVLVCPVCGTRHRLPERWLNGDKSLRCDCDRFTFYPEAERLKRQAANDT